MKFRPLHDVLIVELEPEKKVSKGGIVIPDTSGNPVRVGRVLAAGPGKRWKNKRTGKWAFHRMSAKVGERVMFFMANLETKQGSQLCYMLDDNQGLIRETDVLGVVEGDVEVSA